MLRIAANTAGATRRFNVAPASQTMDQHYVNVLHVLHCIVFAGRMQPATR